MGVLEGLPMRVGRVLGVLACCALTGLVASPVHAGPGEGPSWGAIASMQRWYGIAFNHRSRAEAEADARAQCDRVAGLAGACVVRTYFDRFCGALATGNFGEWGAATASTPGVAGTAAARECDSHLPTEPCKVVVSICSPR
jgi:hypothetical protein